MKNPILLFFALLFSNLTIAQDIIVKTSGDEVTVKVTEITLQDVVYKKPDSLQGRTFTIPKKEVFMIKYGNGSKEVITQETTNEDLEALTPEMAYQRGRQDARRYYKGNDVMWGSAAASVLFPYGYAVPIALGLTKPRIKPSQLPEKSLLQNQNYVRGYENQAHNRKVGKAAAGAGIGTGVVVGILIYVISTF